MTEQGINCKIENLPPSQGRFQETTELPTDNPLRVGDIVDIKAARTHPASGTGECILNKGENGPCRRCGWQVTKTVTPGGKA